MSLQTNSSSLLFGTESNINTFDVATLTYPISRQGLTAISDYLEQERVDDQEKWQSHALFLSPAKIPMGMVA